VSASTTPEEWELKILSDGEDPSAMRMLNPTGSLEETQLRQLEPYEIKIREAVEKTRDTAQGLMARLIADMKSHAAGESLPELSTEPCEDKAGRGAIETEKAKEQSIRASVEERMEEMRLESLPVKFTAVMEQIAAGEAPDKIELSVSRITDKECKELATALKKDEIVKHLNLSFNEIGDVGIQALVTALATGAAKNLEKLEINNNKFGDMGRRMMGGVTMMRKGLKVTYESGIDQIGEKP